MTSKYKDSWHIGSSKTASSTDTHAWSIDMYVYIFWTYIPVHAHAIQHVTRQIIHYGYQPYLVAHMPVVSKGVGVVEIDCTLQGWTLSDSKEQAVTVSQKVIPIYIR